MKIKNLLIGICASLLVIGCSGGMGDGCCGWSGRDITATGQVKKVMKITPWAFCPDYHVLDVSLGIMKNGVGSMSKEDIYLWIPENSVDELSKAAEDGALITFTYDVRRSSNCVDEKSRMTKFKRIQNSN